MKRLIVLAMAACIAAPASAVSPIADIHCAPRDEIRRTLETRLGAVRQGSGMRGPEAIMEIWSNPTSGEWTLVQTYAEGQSCIVAMGEMWELASQKPAG